MSILETFPFACSHSCDSCALIPSVGQACTLRLPPAILCALRRLILESLISRYHSWSLESLCSSVFYQTTNGRPERLSDLPKNTV